MKKIISLVFTFTLLFTGLFALPGFEPYIPDTAGEFVYYRDYSFERESYIGLLAYDNQTFQIKYYAPADKENLLPETSLGILFTINPESNFFDMTGEKLLTSAIPSENEIDILNYLHDILYEFSSRRIKMGPVESRNITSKQEYLQFGGEVILTFDCVIPLFNLKSITDPTGKIIFDCATIGIISSSQDTSFDNFKGLPKVDFPKASKKFKSKAKKQIYMTEDKQQITLDNDWQEIMPGFWALNESALLSMNKIAFSTEKEDFSNYFILRKLISSAENSYVDFSTMEILQNDKTNQIKIVTNNHQPASDKVIKNIKIITPLENEYSFFSLAIFEPDYTNKRSYFDKIVKSYKLID